MATIVGVLLAAGIGRRFDPSGNRLKLLEPGPSTGVPIAAAAARALKAALDDAVAVVRPADSPQQRQLHALLAAEGCRLVVCERAELGMGESLACGVRATEKADGWVVALADMPALAPATIRAVADALRAGHATAAPFVDAQRGHPVGFAHALFEPLAQLQGDVGARDILRAHPPYRIPTSDRGCLLDIDFPP
jgi:molybdenum cofactor cytidylyltransferase